MEITPVSDKTAAHTCAPCRKAKRRCDKLIPSCSLCQRLGRPCNYSEEPASEDRLRSRIRELEELVICLSSPNPSSLSSSSVGFSEATTTDSDSIYPRTLSSRMLFLDSDIAKYTNYVPIMTVDIPIPLDVAEHLGDQFHMDHIKRQYFESAHNWMPIISKVKFGQLMDAAQKQTKMRADLALLLLSMKLVQEVPEANPEQAALYTAAKQFCYTLEAAGIFSLLKVQACLLITVYELGHAIFPQVWMSIGHCARQGVALGIHHKSAPQMLRKPRTWLDWEERQRVWWLIMILDRYITAGSDHRPLNTEDPTRETYIPAEEGAWDRGEMVSPERLFVSSPTSIPVSEFARLAQASHLLGRVIRHCDDDTPDMGFIMEDMEVLSQATTSLLNLLTRDRDHTIHFHVPVAICFSALMKLGDFHSCDSFAEGKPIDRDAFPIVRQCTERALVIMKETSLQIVTFIQILNQSLLSGNDMASLSPLLFHCVYRAAAALSYMATVTSGIERNPYATGKVLCVEILQKANVRWRAAGAYLEVFQTVEEHLNDDE